MVYVDQQDSYALGTRWSEVIPQILDGKLVHILRHEVATLMLFGLDFLQNPIQPEDINHDGIISPLDVLLVINYLNASSRSPLLGSASELNSSANYLDVSGDGLISRLDALIIINWLNRAPGQSESEGESAFGQIDTACTVSTRSIPSVAKHQRPEAYPWLASDRRINDVHSKKSIAYESGLETNERSLFGFLETNEPVDHELAREIAIRELTFDFGDFYDF